MAARVRAAPAVTATWDTVLARRMARQFLSGPPAGALVPLVRRLSGVHAQLGSAAEAAVRLRTSGRIGPADVRRALAEDRTLVKTWTVRGTLHLLPSEDLPLWTAALSARKFARPESWYRYHGVAPDDLAAIEDVVPEVLSAEPMTREVLASTVVARTGRNHLGELLRSGWGALLKRTAARGGLAFGPPDGTSVTFVSPRAWLGEWEPVDPAEAVAEVLRRYLDVYGPADLEDLVGWSAFERPAIRRALADLGDEVVEVGTEEHRGWTTRAAAEELAAAPGTAEPVVRLLGGFDPYVTGSLKQLGLLVPEGRKAAVSRTSGWISPVLVDGGRIVGTWTSENRGGRLAVEITPFGRFRRGVKAAAADEAARWADAVPLTLTWT